LNFWKIRKFLSLQCNYKKSIIYVFIIMYLLSITSLLKKMWQLKRKKKSLDIFPKYEFNLKFQKTEIYILQFVKKNMFHFYNNF